MKKTITLVAIAACGIITMFSCKKKDNSGTATGSMTATINGDSFTGNRCVATIENDTMLSILGGQANGIVFGNPTISVGSFHYHGVGTYSSTSFYDQAGSIDSASANDSTIDMSKYSVYATLTITATSPNIVGTFSFTTEDSTKVTNGNFTAILVSQQ